MIWNKLVLKQLISAEYLAHTFLTLIHLLRLKNELFSQNSILWF